MHYSFFYICRFRNTKPGVYKLGFTTCLKLLSCSSLCATGMRPDFINIYQIPYDLTYTIKNMIFDFLTQHHTYDNQTSIHFFDEKHLNIIQQYVRTIGMGLDCQISEILNTNIVHDQCTCCGRLLIRHNEINLKEINKFIAEIMINKYGMDYVTDLSYGLINEIYD